MWNSIVSVPDHCLFSSPEQSSRRAVVLPLASALALALALALTLALALASASTNVKALR